MCTPGPPLRSARLFSCRLPTACNRITPPPPNSNRNPVSALYKISTHSTPSKGGLFPIKSMQNRGTFGAASTVGSTRLCHNAVFSTKRHIFNHDTHDTPQTHMAACLCTHTLPRVHVCDTSWCNASLRNRDPRRNSANAHGERLPELVGCSVVRLCSNPPRVRVFEPCTCSFIRKLESLALSHAAARWMDVLRS
jgi:hypothetical protein